jgi:hypothetical protein
MKIVTYKCFGLFDVLMSKEELAIQIAQVDSVEINDVYCAEAVHHQILEKFAPNAASPDHQDTGLVASV